MVRDVLFFEVDNHSHSLVNFCWFHVGFFGVCGLDTSTTTFRRSPPGDGSLGPLLDPRLSRLQFGHRIIKEPELDLKVRHLEEKGEAAWTIIKTYPDLLNYEHVCIYVSFIIRKYVSICKSRSCYIIKRSRHDKQACVCAQVLWYLIVGCIPRQHVPVRSLYTYIYIYT